MPEDQQDFYRIQKLPPYVFAVINEMRAKARAAQIDVIDLGMGNPDGATPRVVVNKLIEAARNAKNHRYSQSRGIPRLREEIAARYKTNYGVEIDADTEAIVTIGAKDALAHLLFATIGHNVACAATTDFELRREAKRHAALERYRPARKPWRQNRRGAGWGKK